jgi:hypothetical protein
MRQPTGASSRVLDYRTSCVARRTTHSEAARCFPSTGSSRRPVSITPGPDTIIRLLCGDCNEVSEPLTRPLGHLAAAYGQQTGTRASRTGSPAWSNRLNRAVCRLIQAPAATAGKQVVDTRDREAQPRLRTAAQAAGIKLAGVVVDPAALDAEVDGELIGGDETTALEGRGVESVSRVFGKRRKRS